MNALPTSILEEITLAANERAAFAANERAAFAWDSGRFNGNEWEQAVQSALIHEVVERCLSMVPTTPDHNYVRDYFGLDSPEQRQTRLNKLITDSLVANRTIGYWHSLPEDEWESTAALLTTHPIRSGSGTHCFDDEYVADDRHYRVTRQLSTTKGSDIIGVDFHKLLPGEIA